MKNLMHCLEVRRFREGEIIANEMEESLEVMFVNKGRYDIGYEINNKRFFRRQFGQSTIIGGFQIMYGKRHMFIYRACNEVDCMSIRKEKFLKLVQQYPSLKV